MDYLKYSNKFQRYIPIFSALISYTKRRQCSIYIENIVQTTWYKKLTEFRAWLVDRVCQSITLVWTLFGRLLHSCSSMLLLLRQIELCFWGNSEKPKYFQKSNSDLCVVLTSFEVLVCQMGELYWQVELDYTLRLPKVPKGNILQKLFPSDVACFVASRGSLEFLLIW